MTCLQRLWPAQAMRDAALKAGGFCTDCGKCLERSRHPFLPLTLCSGARLGAGR